MSGRLRSGIRAFARRYLIAFVLSATFMVGAVVMVNYVFETKFDRIARREVDTVEAPTDVTNFLLIGSDTRAFVETEEEEQAFGNASDDAGGQRSDTLMVVHVDPNRQRASVVSFPRDLWIEIPDVPLDDEHCALVDGERCMSKINSAFGNGPDVVVETLSHNFDIPINHYLEINFETFQGIVDAIGTVPIYFPYPTRDDGTGLYAPIAGCHELDGEAALAYARARNLIYYSFPRSDWYDADQTADLARIRRQQDFMRRLMSRAVSESADNPLTASRVIDEIVENLTVDDDLEKEDLLSLVSVFSDVDPDDSRTVEFHTLPSRNGSEGDLSVLHVQEPEATRLLDDLRDGRRDRSSATTTTTTQPSSGVATTGTTGTTSAAATTTTTTPVFTIDEDEFGPAAELTPPCL